MISPAATEAAIDSDSLTKPRAKAKAAEGATTAMTIISSAFTLGRYSLPWDDRWFGGAAGQRRPRSCPILEQIGGASNGFSAETIGKIARQARQNAESHGRLPSARDDAQLGRRDEPRPARRATRGRDDGRRQAWPDHRRRQRRRRLRQLPAACRLPRRRRRFACPRRRLLVRQCRADQPEHLRAVQHAGPHLAGAAHARRPARTARRALGLFAAGAALADRLPRGGQAAKGGGGGAPRGGRAPRLLRRLYAAAQGGRRRGPHPAGAGAPRSQAR